MQRRVYPHKRHAGGRFFRDRRDPDPDPCNRTWIGPDNAPDDLGLRRSAAAMVNSAAFDSFRATT